MTMRTLRLSIILALLAGGRLHAAIVVNEIMYNSVESQDVEYIELINTGPGTQNLSGWYLLDDNDTHAPCMLAGTLAPNQILVAAVDIGLFQAKYPGVTNLNPNACDGNPPGTGFNLGNATDQVRLFNAAAVLADSVTYGDNAPWPSAPDGNGPALELFNPALDNSLPSSWGASSGQGTPGSQNSNFDPDLPPLIDRVARDIPLPDAGDAVIITAAITDDAGLSTVELNVDTGGGFSPTPMFDDGLHGDGVAADGVHGATIAPHPLGTLVRYYVRAADTQSQQSVHPVAAPTDYLAYTVGHRPPPLTINELLASNQNGIQDAGGDRDDWLEIYNPGPDPALLQGMFLSDNLEQTRDWPLPATTLPPGGTLLFWCDEEAQEGPFHASFKLPAEGGEVGLFDSVDHGNTLIHGVTFGLQSPDRSFGYRPEGADAPDYLFTPTPTLSNEGSAFFSAICINEFLTASAVGVEDWVELYNRGSVAVDISNWHLSDDVDTPLKYTFPAGTSIPAGDWLSVDQDELGFGLDANGSEVLMLTHADGTTGQDYFDSGPQFADVSQGRYPDGTANWHFFSDSSRDLPNSCDQGVSQLGPVEQLRFTSKTALAWDALPGAESYDVVKGDLLLLGASQGDFAAAAADCLEHNGADERSWEPATPAGGFFYLVRGSTYACALGTYNSGGVSQVGDRDVELATAPGSCP